MRVYAIKYRIYFGAAGKYSAPQRYEDREEFYSQRERQVWIENYKRYKRDDMIYDNVEAYWADMHQIEDMEKVINAI